MKAFELFNEWPCPTVVAAVIDRDGVSHGYGDGDQRLPLASVTKLLTAAAVHLAIEEGTIAVGDELDAHGGTTYDLLGHASGLAPGGERVDEPGRRRIYSNAGYERLASALEQRADMTFAEYLEEGIFDPLGMRSTELLGSPAHGVQSTANDLVRFLDGIGGLLAASTIDTMTTPYLPELIGVLPGYGRQSPNTWGLGPEIRHNKSPHWTGATNHPRTWGHFGATGTFLWVDPVAATSMIVLTDRDFGQWAIPRWTAVSDAVLDELAD